MLKIHPENPSTRHIEQVVEVLKEGGVMIYPTDTVYGLGCDIFNNDAVEKICRLRGLDPTKAMLSFVCEDIAQIAEYASQIDNGVFKLMKRNLPGPFTFVLNSNNKVPKMFKNRKRTIGVRIPDNKIVMEIVKALGRPILSTSLRSDDEILEYYTDPYDINEEYKNQVELVIDGGIGNNVPSTIIDCTGSTPEIIRQGEAELVE